MKGIITPVVFALITMIVACKEDDGPDVANADRAFAEKAAMANRAEIELGTLATERAGLPEVNAYGSHMVNEHTTALNELKAIAAPKQISLPSNLDEEHESLRNRLMGLSGISFDTAFMGAMVKDHQHAISMFEEQAANGKDPDLKAYAEKSLPKLQLHLEDAERFLQLARDSIMMQSN